MQTIDQPGACLHVMEKMSPQTNPPPGRLNLEAMKSFAHFLKGHLDEYTDEWLRLTRSVDTPLLRYLNQYSEIELLRIGRQSATELLEAFIDDRSSEYITTAVHRWLENRLPLIEQNQIQIDDVYYVPHIRKQVLFGFIPRYTEDPQLIITLVREIDEFTHVQVVTAYRVFMNILEDRICSQGNKLAESERLYQQAEAIANSRLEEYAFIASHDLKEPLRKISLFSERLGSLLSLNTDEEVMLCLDKIFSSARRMQRMINDLLSISQVAGEKSFVLTDLGALLEEVVAGLDHKIVELHGHVTSDRLPVARVIAAQFRQLFSNLIMNSLKFARPGVEPRIDFSHSYIGPEDVKPGKILPSKQYLRIRVSDNGIGFDNSFSEKIFGIFQRLHSRVGIEGTGMGLAICKKVVENHGGYIYAEGREGEGATFTLVIPA